MTSETLHPNPEQTPLTMLNQKQDELVKRIHALEKNPSGDTFFGPMNIYREPQAITLKIRNNGSTISLDQVRFETDGLGIRSRITLTHEAITEDGKATTTYRCDSKKAVKRCMNGQESVTTDMTNEDFGIANRLLDAIDGMITASLKLRTPQSQEK